MANKKSVNVQYQGADNKTKMLVDAINRNVDDIKHPITMVNSLSGDPWDGDVSFNVTSFLTKRSSNYNNITILNDGFVFKESKSDIEQNKEDDYNNLVNHPWNTKIRRYVLFEINANIERDVEWTIEFDATVAANKFDLDNRYRLGVFIACSGVDDGDNTDVTFPYVYYHATQREASALTNCYTATLFKDPSNSDFLETLGNYYTVSIPYYYDPHTAEDPKSVEETIYYQSLYRDGIKHHYTCPIRFNHSGIIQLILVVDSFLYNSSIGYVYDESKSNLILIDNISGPNFVTEYRTHELNYFREETNEWINALNRIPLLYSGYDKPMFSIGQDNDLYAELSEKEDITEEVFSNMTVSSTFRGIEHSFYKYDGEIITIGGGFENWKYNEPTYSANGIAISISGFNFRDTWSNVNTGAGYITEPDSSVIVASPHDEYWVNLNNESSITLHLNNLKPKEKYYIEYTIELDNDLQLDNAYSRYIQDYRADIPFLKSSKYARGIIKPLSNAFDPTLDQGTTYISGLIECFTDDDAVIDLTMDLTSVGNNAYKVDYGPKYSDEPKHRRYNSSTGQVQDPFDIKEDSYGYADMDQLTEYRGSGEYNTLYLVREEFGRTQPWLARYFWVEYKTPDGWARWQSESGNQPPGNPLNIQLKNIKIYQYRSYNDIYYKHEGQWLKHLNSGGEGSKVNIVPLYSSGIKVANITVDGTDCSIWIPESGYELPPATSNTLGGIKVGDNLTITQDGRLNASSGGTTVVANPSGPATEDLNKIQIANTIYRIQGSSGDEVSYDPVITQGELLGYINVGSTQYPVYAPMSGGGGEGEGQMIVPFIEINKVPTLGEIVYANETSVYMPINVILTPIMTSNTAPSGTIVCSSYYSNNNDYNGWQAFNAKSCDSSCKYGWLANSSDEAPYLTYSWDSEKTLSKVIIETYNNNTTTTKTVFIEGLNSNDTWENCLSTGVSVSLDFTKFIHTTYEIALNGHKYSAFRISGNEAWYVSGTSGYSCVISEIQILQLAV